MRWFVLMSAAACEVAAPADGPGDDLPMPDTHVVADASGGDSGAVDTDVDSGATGTGRDRGEDTDLAPDSDTALGPWVPPWHSGWVSPDTGWWSGVPDTWAPPDTGWPPPGPYPWDTDHVVPDTARPEPVYPQGVPSGWTASGCPVTADRVVDHLVDDSMWALTSTWSPGGWIGTVGLPDRTLVWGDVSVARDLMFGVAPGEVVAIRVTFDPPLELARATVDHHAFQVDFTTYERGNVGFDWVYPPLVEAAASHGWAIDRVDLHLSVDETQLDHALIEGSVGFDEPAPGVPLSCVVLRFEVPDRVSTRGPSLPTPMDPVFGRLRFQAYEFGDQRHLDPLVRFAP